MRAILAALLSTATLVSTARAFDPTLPASVQVTLHDADDRPVPGASVSFKPASYLLDVKPFVAKSDAQGVARLEVAMNADGFLLGEWVIDSPTSTTTSAGYMELFAGGQFEKSIRLQPQHKTVIHVRGPAGEAPRSVPVQISYLDAETWTSPTIRGLRTDEHGDLSWTHAPMPGGFFVGVAGDSFVEKDDPETTIHLTARQIASFMIGGTLQATILHADGTPARDWLVATHITSNSWGGVMGVPFFNYLTDRFERVPMMAYMPAAPRDRSSLWFRPTELRLFIASSRNGGRRAIIA